MAVPVGSENLLKKCQNLGIDPEKIDRTPCSAEEAYQLRLKKKILSKKLKNFGILHKAWKKHAKHLEKNLKAKETEIKKLKKKMKKLEKKSGDRTTKGLRRSISPRRLQLVETDIGGNEEPMEFEETDWSNYVAPPTPNPVVVGVAAAPPKAGKRHQCNECPKSFKKPSKLRRHQNSHLRQKHAPPIVRPFTCPLCGVHVTRKGHLARHIQNVHKKAASEAKELSGIGDKSSLGLGSFKCPLCARCLSRKDHLAKHIKNVHKMSDEEANTVLGKQLTKLAKAYQSKAL